MTQRIAPWARTGNEVAWDVLSHSNGRGICLPSPPVLRGRGVGGEGEVAACLSPPHPYPSPPEYRGRGERQAHPSKYLRAGDPIRLVWLIVFSLSVAAARAQDAVDQPTKTILPGEVRHVTARLAAAADLVRRAQWAEALDEYQRLIAEAGDELVPLPEDRISGCQRSIQVRRLCHVRLAALPPAALHRYRSRVEVQAEKWLCQGVVEHDIRTLRRIVDDAFCSRAAGRALDVLGDLAFEQGYFDEALNWWRMLAPPAGTSPDRPVQELICPDAAMDLARAQAKQILARLFQGDFDNAVQELQAFRKLHPGTPGTLAGCTGAYADTVQALLEQARAGPMLESPDWPTFGGAPSRSRHLAAAPSRRAWAEGPAWRVRLTTGEFIKPTAHVPALTLSPGHQPATHPVIAGDRVFVADTRRVLGFHLLTGQLLFRYEMKSAKEALEPEGPSAGRRHGGACHTLTVADNRLYACLGTALLGLGKDGARPWAGSSALICLDVGGNAPEQPAHAGKGLEFWRIDGHTLRDVPTVFEGAPLVHRDRVYVAFTGLVGGRAQTAVACYDAASGTLRWRQDVCETSDYENRATPRRRQNLLTLAGTHIVYCSHSGAIVALDALTGKRIWGVRYPHRVARAEILGSLGQSIADEASGGEPCVYDGGRLFAAPADSDRVLCLDPQTGRVLWVRDGMNVVSLLGPSKGRLLLTTSTGMRALAAATGGDRGGWAQPDVGHLASSGRGLLAGGWVFWPTQDPLLPTRALRVSDGRQQQGDDAYEPTELRHLLPGNFAAAGGCLVVAGAEELVGYAPRRGESPARKDHGLLPARGQDARIRVPFSQGVLASTGMGGTEVSTSERPLLPTASGARVIPTQGQVGKCRYDDVNHAEERTLEDTVTR
jgi:outer membrane protein assembly factor BamB